MGVAAKVEGPLKQYDAAYLHLVPVYELKPTGDWEIKMVDVNGRKVPEERNLFDPAVTRQVSIGDCKRCEMLEKEEESARSSEGVRYVSRALFHGLKSVKD